MKTHMKRYLPGIRVLIAGIGLVLAGRARAQPFSFLYKFTLLNWETTSTMPIRTPVGQTEEVRAASGH